MLFLYSGVFDMNDENKTQEQFIDELKGLRQCISADDLSKVGVL